MSVFRFLIFNVILFSLNNTVFAQSYSIKGQFWGSGLTSNNAPPGQPSLESNIGYIPTLSLLRELDNNRLLDMELSYRLDYIYSGDSFLKNTEAFHRYWIRYSNNKLEARLGLQKIVFGPSQILRILSWFDNFDPKDPTGKTDGVKAFRLRWFPSNSLSLWSWAIMNNEDTLSYGGRGELLTNIGDLGFTYHQDPSKSLQTIGQFGTAISYPHNRLAIDYRYDGFVGLWNESAMIKSKELELSMFMVGADYTLPIADGILIISESMHISSKENNSTSSMTFTAFMASVPVGIVHHAMFISQFGWDENHTYNYLRWRSTYDHFSINFILSFNPKRKDYNVPVEFLPKTLAGFGTGIQFMLIYNH